MTTGIVSKRRCAAVRRLAVDAGGLSMFNAGPALVSW